MQKLSLRQGYFRDESGKPVYLMGANFWPKRNGPWMYRDAWRPQEVASDLAELAALGTNAVRVFCFTPDFMPAPDVVSREAIDRLAQTIKLAADIGLYSIPTFLVGHMSGENWQTNWSAGRSWYTDPVVLDASELLVGTLGSHFSGDSRIAAWLLTNEWPLFAGITIDEVGIAWAKRLCAVLRAADPSCIVSLGDGAWDVINGQPSGLPAEALRNIIDFFGPHFYPKESDWLRHRAYASFAMRMLQPLDKPVVLEEFGCSSDQADDELAGDYYRTVLWSAFGAGNCGTLFWNSHDFTISERRPYSHHPYELHFGVIRSDGSLKPQATEVKRFCSFLRTYDPDVWVANKPSALIGRTSYYNNQYPFDWGWSKPQLRDLFLQAYTNLSMSGVNAGFVDLASCADSNTKLIVVPCLQQVTTQDAAQLEKFVREGGTVYLSYGGEPWFPNLSAFIGARALITYGLVGTPPDEPLRVRFESQFGSINKDAELLFMARGERRRAAPLSCERVAARVIARDQDGNPVVFDHSLGAGRVVFVTYAFEYFALDGLEGSARDDLWKLYAATAEVAGALPAIRASERHVQSFVWNSAKHPEVRRVLLINHGRSAVKPRLVSMPDGARDVETDQGVNVPELTMAPKEVRMLEFSGP